MVGIKNMSMVQQLVTVAAAFLLIKGIAAATITVGGDAGWDEPSTSTFYADWAAKQTFAVDDVLEFKWTGNHRVAEVTKDEYESCQTSNPISLHVASPVSITLTTTGNKYYICTVSDHCANHQKLAVNVGGTGNSSSVASPPPPASGSDSGSESGTNGATSLNLGIFVTFVFLVLGLLLVN